MARPETRFLDIRFNSFSQKFRLHHNYYVSNLGHEETYGIELEVMNLFIKNNPNEIHRGCAKNRWLRGAPRRFQNQVKRMIKGYKHLEVMDNATDALDMRAQDALGHGYIDIQESQVSEYLPGADVGGCA